MKEKTQNILTLAKPVHSSFTKERSKESHHYLFVQMKHKFGFVVPVPNFAVCKGKSSIKKRIFYGQADRKG